MSGMPQTGPGPDPQNALDAALDRFDASRAANRAKASREREPCAPDPELSNLFAEFARRMPGRLSVPFVHEEQGQHVETIRTGLFKKDKTETRTIYRHQEVARGWPIAGIGGRFTASVSKMREKEVWYGLAIDTEGKPWFAQEATSEHSYWGPLHTSEMLRVSGRLSGNSPGSRQQLGRPTGEDLRYAIRSFCRGDLRHDLGVEYLPKLIADAMASAIRGAG